MFKRRIKFTALCLSSGVLLQLGACVGPLLGTLAQDVFGLVIGGVLTAVLSALTGAANNADMMM